MADLGLKAINLEDPFNPLRNLWRNVLIVAIEDAIKIKRQTVKYKEVSFMKSEDFMSWIMYHYQTETLIMFVQWQS